MVPTTIHWRNLASATVNYCIKARLSSFRGLTLREVQRYHQVLSSAAHLPPKLIPQASLPEQVLQPWIYSASSSAWVAVKDDGQKCLPRGSSLKVASWNLDSMAPGPSARAAAALNHLQQIFGKFPTQLVVMLQEVREDTLQVIMESPWIQQNFVLTNVEAPKSIFKQVPGPSFIMNDILWSVAPIFTIMMIPRSLGSVHCFRAPFATKGARDVLCVDVPISTSDMSSRSNDSLRLCTTHLESGLSGRPYRFGQLAIISRLMKRPEASKSNIIGGLLGGDMNHIAEPEHEMHRSGHIGLKDVWEDFPAGAVPLLKSVRDPYISSHQARGCTHGWQSGESRANRDLHRLDKFFYSGQVEAVALTEPQDVTGKLGRIGLGLKKIEVDAWRTERTYEGRISGRYFKSTRREWCSSTQMRLLREKGHKGSFVRSKSRVWVSDHYGIAVGIRVVDPAN